MPTVAFCVFFGSLPEMPCANRTHVTWNPRRGYFPRAMVLIWSRAPGAQFLRWILGGQWDIYTQYNSHCMMGINPVYYWAWLFGVVELTPHTGSHVRPGGWQNSKPSYLTRGTWATPATRLISHKAHGGDRRSMGLHSPSHKAHFPIGPMG